MKFLLAGLIVLGTAAAALADIQVRFNESAPKDSFVVRNAGDCTLSDLSITIDLATSQAGLIFDVTGSGAGVEVFQPLEWVSGGDALRSVPEEVKDGDTQLTLDVRALGAGDEIAFTIDVDDTIGQREITVSDAEIEGARVTASKDGKRRDAHFDRSALAVVALTGCRL
ncbi:MAG: aggregation factor core [Pseudomonadota bacterium]